MQPQGQVPFFSLLIASQTQTIPPRGLAKYLLLIQEINSRSKVMDHNVLMCCSLRCFHFNRGLQCLNCKVKAVVDLLLALCLVQGPRASPITAQGSRLPKGVTASHRAKVQGPLFKMAEKGEKNFYRSFQSKLTKNNKNHNNFFFSR